MELYIYTRDVIYFKYVRINVVKLLLYVHPNTF